MFKIIAIVCVVSMGGHMLDCQRFEETDKRTFHTEEACLEEAGHKYNQLLEILKRPEVQYPDNFYTLHVFCEPKDKNSI